jgi:hypothetical protein
VQSLLENNSCSLVDRVKEEEEEEDVVVVVVVAGEVSEARCQRRGVDGEGVGGQDVSMVVLSWSKSPRHYRLLGASETYQS